MISTHYRRAVKHLEESAFLVLTLVRLVLGSVFIDAGLGKLRHLPDTVQFFMDINLPSPHFSAIFASTHEVICGIFILIGFATRIAAIPLIIIMTVAIIAAQWTDVGSIQDLLSLHDFNYIVLSLILLMFGPGKISIDHVISRYLNR